MTILVELSLLPSIANRRAATIYIPFQAKMLFTLRRTGPGPFQSIDSTGHKARVVQDDSRSTRDDGARSADERRHEVVRDSSAHLRDMIKRAGEGKAVDADLDLVIRLFQDKYPLTFLPESVTSRRIPNYDKVNPRFLKAYYSRCQSLVLRSGGRDNL
ncbi:hypothetical protein E4U28_005266 [Claviceps purpurea]|nr:hypothetical protein E4U28_005266 [Claviceps purpurea]